MFCDFHCGVNCLRHAACMRIFLQPSSIKKAEAIKYSSSRHVVTGLRVYVRIYTELKEGEFTHVLELRK